MEKDKICNYAKTKHEKIITTTELAFITGAQVNIFSSCLHGWSGSRSRRNHNYGNLC